MSTLRIEDWIGLRTGESIEEYHSDKTAISKSGLDLLNLSPFIYYSRSLDPLRWPEPSRAGQLEGNLAHCAILEPNEFGKRYVIGPTVNRNTKVWHEFVDSNKDRIAIQNDQYEVAMRQADSVRKLADIREYLSKGKSEVSARWVDMETGVRCRCRPDHVSPVGTRTDVLLDVKTYSNAGPEEFARQIARKAYHVQDAFYSDGYTVASGRDVVQFIFIAVETEWPFAACSYRLNAESREEGFNEYRRLLDIYESCLRSNKWPGYAEQTREIELPPYAFATREVEIAYV